MNNKITLPLLTIGLLFSNLAFSAGNKIVSFKDDNGVEVSCTTDKDPVECINKQGENVICSNTEESGYICSTEE